MFNRRLNFTSEFLRKNLKISILNQFFIPSVKCFWFHTFGCSEWQISGLLIVIIGYNFRVIFTQLMHIIQYSIRIAKCTQIEAKSNLKRKY